MLFTVLIVSLMLTIAIGIASITFKQNALSSLAKDSQIAFYQADAGVECGKYYDTKLFVLDENATIAMAQTDPARVPPTIQCGNTILKLQDESYDHYFVYRQEYLKHEPCFSIIFDKTAPVDESGIKKFKIRGNGYNLCDASPRQVQRSFEYIY